METESEHASKIFFDLIAYDENINTKHDYMNLGSFFIYEKDLKEVSTKEICKYIKNNIRDFISDYYNGYIKEIEIINCYDVFYVTFVRLKIVTKYANYIYQRYLSVSNIHKI